MGSHGVGSPDGGDVCPSLFQPKHESVPSTRMPHPNPAPTAKSRKVPGTSTGDGSGLVGAPRYPQHWTVPAPSRAHADSSNAFTSTNCPCGGWMLSCCGSAPPQQNKVWSADRIPHAKSSPAAMSVITSDGSGADSAGAHAGVPSARREEDTQWGPGPENLDGLHGPGIILAEILAPRKSPTSVITF